MAIPVKNIVNLKHLAIFPKSAEHSRTFERICLPPDIQSPETEYRRSLEQREVLNGMQEQPVHSLLVLCLAER